MLINPVFRAVGYYFCSAVFHLVFLVEHSELKDVKECSLSDTFQNKWEKKIREVCGIKWFSLPFCTPFFKRNKTNTLDISYLMCLFGCLQFSGGKIHIMLIVLILFF